ncbi:UDP-2,3-diacylglucosamine pyrophosphatase LpxH [Clostridium punense]|uniref:UDP-2,3-diacylglucosamine pyrophosphatase LpxH n=1 Tax=Clostridium punense TaxID=1054297 RepID=A0ABS4JYA3_9CLOT|nr:MULTISPECIES: metallophosphoesterase [Clostridium]MBP2020513.1 UDP-2,3-diacylglucosamine pyrophosphatase LpxH [Clostridium punense]
MLKKFIRLILFLIIILAGFPIVSFASKEKGEVPILQIPVISDVHIGDGKAEDKTTKVLKDYKTLAPGYRAIAIVGDMTDCGLEEQYDKFNKLLEENMSQGAEKIITIGNHEFFEGRFFKKPGLTDEILTDRFIRKTQMPGVYYDKWIEGYHCIVLGGEKSNLSDETIGDKAIISEEQYKWLEKVLQKKVRPDKPIFIFLHQPIDNTVYGSTQWGGGLSDGRLYNLLREYPQAILFTAHSHYPLNHPKTLYQNNFTMVNTGAIRYILGEDGTVRSGDMQGLLVNVYKNRVEIKARDFAKDIWINQSTINLPGKQSFIDKIKRNILNR